MERFMRATTLKMLCFGIVLAALCVVSPTGVRGWGPHGHALSGQAAAMKLPATAPKFLRRAVDQLTYLNPEPDRWKDRVESDLDKAISSGTFDHYIDLEYVPQGALDSPTRYDFAVEMVKSGRKATDAGFLPYRILELYQRVRVEFRLWRTEKDTNRRSWIEQRIINDAGILGHYVSDGANPHHTTMHHNGWVGANPKGYTVFSREHGFHFRFEDEFVGARIQLNDVLPLVGSTPRVIDKPREAVLAYLRSSFALVEELYVLDKKEPFGISSTSAENKKFAAARLAAGAEMLRDLWWSAWITSETQPAPAASK
jgi:hypothetical protein